MSLLDTIRAEHEAAGFPTVDSELGFRTVCPVCRQHSTVRAAGENDVEIECRSGCERIRVAEELHRLNSASWLAAEATGWRWIEEIVAVAPEEPDWIFEGYLAPGTKVMLAGQPKAGKTTWLMALLGAIANDAESFLGRRVRGGIVVALSEEGDATLAPKAENLRRHRVRVLNRDAAWPKPSWVDVINKAVAEAKRIEALMLVIDSLSFWAQFRPDGEKDASTAQAAIDALDGACRNGLVVLLVHHQRKELKGDHGGDIRSSGALLGAVDVAVEFERLGEGSPPTHRRLVSQSRWPASTPAVWIVDYDPSDSSWRSVGEAEDRESAVRVGARGRILALIESRPGLTESEIVDELEGDRRKTAELLRELLKSRRVMRTGGGRKGDPFRYSPPTEKPLALHETNGAGAIPLPPSDWKPYRPAGANHDDEEYYR